MSIQGRIGLLTCVTLLAVGVTITRYQPGSARVVVCQDGRGFVIFHPGGMRETYGTGFTLETIEWFHRLESARSRQESVDDPAATCTRDEVLRSMRRPKSKEPTTRSREGGG